MVCVQYIRTPIPRAGERNGPRSRRRPRTLLLVVFAQEECRLLPRLFSAAAQLNLPPSKSCCFLSSSFSLSGLRVRAKNSRTATYKSPPTQRKRHQFTNSSVKRRSQKETNYPPPSTHLSTRTFKMKVRENPCFVGDFNAREILPALEYIFITVPRLLRFVLAPCY